MGLYEEIAEEYDVLIRFQERVHSEAVKLQNWVQRYRLKSVVDVACGTGDVALEIWRQVAVTYPFQWLALWPLIALASRGNDLSRAVELIEKLTDREQQSLGTSMEKRLEQVVRCQRAGESRQAAKELERVLQAASLEGYL